MDGLDRQDLTSLFIGKFIACYEMIYVICIYMQFNLKHIGEKLSYPFKRDNLTRCKENLTRGQFP